MNEKKKQISSGAEKAENLERTKKPAATKSGKTTKKAVKNSGAKKNESKSVKNTKTETEKVKKTKKQKPAKKVNEKRAQAKKAREEKRLQAAKIRAERKQKKLERKLEHKEKKLARIAEMKEKKAERKEKRRERKDLLRNETKSERIERKKEERRALIEAKAAKREAAAANKRAKREHRLKVRAQKQAEKNDKRHAPGFGGWLAAVISLGVTTLALGTVLTFGWINMNGMQAEMSNVHTQSVYELNSVVDNLDTNLSKARVAMSDSDKVKILSDIAIESEMAEVLLERLPMDITFTEELASFINKMGDSAQSMLYTVARGGELTPSQEKSLEYMYETNLKVKRALNEMTADTNGADLMNCMRGKGSIIGESFTELQNNVIEAPKGIQDGPFSDSIKDTNPSFIKGLSEITAPRAEELAKKYFNDYKISDARCTGEAVANGMTLYNVSLTTPDGEMFAQLTKQGGKVVMFDSFKDCNSKNFSVQRCTDIAEDFLAAIGYGKLKAVWTSENGTTCNLNFAPVQNGVVLYPDLIKIKVCEERGIVTGMEALSYVLNHGERNIATASVTKAEAKSAINGNIDVKGSRLALIPLDNGEVLAYEFFGTLNGNEYFVYVDAQTGEEIQILTVVGTEQGRALM